MLQVGLIGVGGISKAHISGWEKQKDSRLAALCDIEREKLEPHGDKHCYTDFDEMLAKENLDILDICLPTHLHTKYALQALEKGIHVICEKPVSLKKEDVTLLYETAKKNGVMFMVAQVLRFWPEYEILKNVWEKGVYGKLLSGTMSRLSQMPAWSQRGWMSKKECSGLVPFDLHIHDLDFLVYAFGFPKDVSYRRVCRPEQDYLHADYSFGDFSVSADSAWYAGAYPFTAGFLFQFETAVLAMAGGKLTVYEKGGKVFCPAEDAQSDNGHIGLPASNAYFNEIDYFAHCVLTGKMPDKVKPEELMGVIDILHKA